MKNDVFKMPKTVKIMARSSSITNSFVNGIIPVIEPSEKEIEDALATLGMTKETICCAYCGGPYTEWDHLNPLVEDKKPTGYISEIKNLVPSCGKCNQSKGNKDWEKWMLSDATLSPKTRNVKDLELKIQRLKDYKKKYTPMKIDIKQIIGEELWDLHWANREKVIDLMMECQRTSDEIKKLLASSMKR